MAVFQETNRLVTKKAWIIIFFTLFLSFFLLFQTLQKDQLILKLPTGEFQLDRSVDNIESFRERKYVPESGTEILSYGIIFRNTPFDTLSVGIRPLGTASKIGCERGEPQWPELLPSHISHEVFRACFGDGASQVAMRGACFKKGKCRFVVTQSLHKTSSAFYFDAGHEDRWLEMVEYVKNKLKRVDLY